MTKPLETGPSWEEEDWKGFVTSASAIVTLGRPKADPEGPATRLYLHVEEDEDLLDLDDETEDEVGFVWRYGVDEEEAGFGESEYENAKSADLERAKRDCWGAVIEFLRGEGYSNDEIAGSI